MANVWNAWFKEGRFPRITLYGQSLPTDEQKNQEGVTTTIEIQSVGGLGRFDLAPTVEMQGQRT